MNNRHNTYNKKYIRRRRRPSSPGKSLFYALVLILLIIAFMFARTPAQGLLWRAAAPILGIGNRLANAAQALTLPFTSKESLIAENNALRAELTEAQAQLINRQALADANAELKAALGRSDTPSLTLSNIIARPPQVPYDTIILDAGAPAGVAAGDIVGSGSIALGMITQNTPYNSRAVLFSSPGQSTSAFLNDSIPITLVGQGGGAFTARVPQGTAAAPGDEAVLSNLSQPAVALVAYAQNKPGNQIFKELYLAAPVSIFNLSKVEIWHEALPTTISTSSPQFPSTTNKKKHGQ